MLKHELNLFLKTNVNYFFRFTLIFGLINFVSNDNVYLQGFIPKIQESESDAKTACLFMIFLFDSKFMLCLTYRLLI